MKYAVALSSLKMFLFSWKSFFKNSNAHLAKSTFQQLN